MSTLRVDNIENLDKSVSYPIGQQPASTIRDPENITGFLTPEMFGAVGDGLTDDTQAILSFISEFNEVSEIYWGESGNTYSITDELPGFIEKVHSGLAKIKNGDYYYAVGGGWSNTSNTIYCSQSGSQDGLTPDTPCSFVDALNFIKKAARQQPATRWHIELEDGVYDNPEYRFENWPVTFYPVVIQGKTVESPDDPDAPEPSVVFDAKNTGTNAFRALGDVVNLNLEVRDLKFINFPEGPWYLQCHNLDILAYNIHGSGNGGSFLVRGGVANFRKGIIENGHGGISLQDIYGAVGYRAGDGNLSHGVKFTNITGNCLEISRGSTCYSVGNVFTNVEVGIDLSRKGRVRRVSNHFVSWTTAAITCDPTCRVDDDNLNNPDIFTGGSFGKQTILSYGDPFVQAFTNVGGWSPHLEHYGSRLTFTDIPRTDIAAANPTLAPFRMPAWWLRSPTCGGKIEFYCSIHAGSTITMELSGQGSSVSQVVVPFTYTNSAPSGAQIHKITIEFVGADAPNDDTRGHYCVTVERNGDVSRFVGTTAYLDNSNISWASNELQKFRLYVTVNGTFTIRRMTSYYKL